ncbi:type VI secretion system Vgr family protein [Ralstonia pseudosolanacearum]|uniref:type VI secretion system Vgr family protein n=9 Tax=Ralstonia pseudosolanacearum TaxID=1310165 RepID=UPI0008FC2D21|nr:type VI secretion system Vgr family protein [Ralstonia pseudosolanacearum]AVV67808.1 type VI secretion system tip protein VgrG [Ralstonia solanacearum OE1-1]NKA09940.1 type VI secretion system tip protein VgrG [Ralstonia solanacearum]API75638.1 type VI secretion protein [Ralstonia pseudosolanacearum]QWF62866.1 type VI secretion system tip protein VgrG [Ralstonia solanacearum]TXD89017.1 type VI secretion system tip protein VgrG [Ralstonia pseudosolanacearum]
MYLPQSALSALSGLLGQHTRQITIETALTTDNLVVERFTAKEAVSAPFALHIDCLSPSAHIDTAKLATEEITLRLMLPDGNQRAWHGYVVGCAALGGDGGLARYRLTVGSWFDRLRTRTDCYVYQDKTALEIIEEVLADYPLAHYRWAVNQPLRKRSICAQYRETDFAFVERLLAEEGLSYRFEHEQGDASQSSDGKAAQSRHCLVIFDNDAERPTCAQPEIRFHRVDATEQEDAIERLSRTHTVGTNAVTLASWDYKALAATSAQASANDPGGELPTLESFEASGPYRFKDAKGADHAARLRMQAHEAGYLRYQGQGSVRQLGACQRFKLTQHFDSSHSEFVTLAVEHEAANNLGTDVARLLGTTDIESGSYRNRFTAVPADAPIVPQYRRRPTAPEGQAAVVIADDGAPLTTDRDHRVRVRFPWLRAPDANAFRDPDSSDRGQVSAWVRVATASAGPNWGANHLPRAGTQVLLTYIDGDIDRPLVAMQLHSQQDALPWPAADAPLGQVLSGWHSQGLGGDGYNQWVVDDHPGQLRMRLASSTANSQLNLGYVMSHGATGGERGSWRGTGAELRTDAWAVVRAGAGLLLSTTARPQAGGTVLDAHEARGQLTAAQKTAQRLSDAASSQQALPLAANEAFDPLTQALDPAQDGHYDSNVNGQDATQPNKAPVERFGQPWLAVESPTSIALASQATTTVYAGRHLHGTAQGDWHLAVGNVVAAAAAKGISLFAQRNGIRVIAEGGPMSIQAHTDALSVLADKAVTVTSSADSVEILAQQNIVLHGGDSMIRLEGNAITFETTKLDVKGAGHPLIGPGGQAATLPALPVGALGDPAHFIELNHHYDDLEPVKGASYKLHFSDGTTISGKVDGNGFARHEGVPPGEAKVEWGEDVRTWDAESQRTNDRFGAAADADSAIALVKSMLS